MGCTPVVIGGAVGLVCTRGRRGRPKKCLEHPDRDAVALCDFPEAGSRARTCSVALCAECARPWCLHLLVQPGKRGADPLDLCPRHLAFARRDVDARARGEAVVECGCPGHHGASPAARSLVEHHPSSEAPSPPLSSTAPTNIAEGKTGSVQRAPTARPARCSTHGTSADCLYWTGTTWRCSFDGDPARDLVRPRRDVRAAVLASPHRGPLPGGTGVRAAVLASDPVGRTACFQRRPRGTAPAAQLVLPMFSGGERENDP